MLVHAKFLQFGGKKQRIVYVYRRTLVQSDVEIGGRRSVFLEMEIGNVNIDQKILLKLN